MSIKGLSKVDQESIKGIDQHMTTAAFIAHYPAKSKTKLITYTYVQWLDLQVTRNDWG